MDERTLRVLEYEKIIRQLASHAQLNWANPLLWSLSRLQNKAQ